MNHGIQYGPFVERLSFSPTAYSQIVAQQRSMPKCTIICNQLVAFLSHVFSVFFHWMRPSSVYCWRSSCLDLSSTQVIIPQLISDPVSNTHQISIWSPPTLQDRAREEWSLKINRRAHQGRGRGTTEGQRNFSSCQGGQ